jgi:hypothetical protein
MSNFGSANIDRNSRNYGVGGSSAKFLIQPHVLSALFSIRIPIMDICEAASVPEALLLKACETWEIDIARLHEKALETAKNAANEKSDPDITPFETAVRHGCSRLGWCDERFVQSYKMFRSNRQASSERKIRRPERYQRFQMANLCQLNLMEYFMVWCEHGRDSFLRHGKMRREEDKTHSTALQVCRKDHSQPYTLGNCFIDTQAANMREMHDREQPGKSAAQCQVVVHGIVFESRAEAKRVLDRSESWLCGNEGDYRAGIYKVAEAQEVFFESVRAANDPEVDSTAKTA